VLLAVIVAGLAAGVVAGPAAAGDPAADVAACGGRGAAGDPGVVDLRAASARIVEGGTAVEFRVRFARRPPMSDPVRDPWRLDVVLRDPALPSYSFGYYRDVNRIVRYDAEPPSRIEVLLLPERGENEYLAVHLERRTLVLRLPGRLLVRDEDLGGIPLERLRWSVIARDGDRCDRLGAARPTRRIRGNATVSGPATPNGPPPTVRRPYGVRPVARVPDTGARTVWSVVAILLAVGSIATFRSWVRRGRRPDPVSATDRDPGS
jgi:hypothetical protein